CTSGDEIDDFTLTDASGTKIIEHLGSGCSTGAYDDLTGDPTLSGVLMPGETYDFTTTSSFSSQEVAIWIDFNQNGSFDDAGEELFSSTSGSGNSTTGSIT